MPPKVKTKREDIIKAAFELTREMGFENVNARSIAAKLEISTHPIFRIYTNMTELKKDLFEYINQYFGSYMMNCSKGDNGFSNIGLSYVEFAKNERHLFKMLFLSDNLNMKSFDELVSYEEHDFVLKQTPNPNNLSKEEIKELFTNHWLFAHGIATMISTNALDISQEEIKKLLSNGLKAFSSQ